MAARIPPAVALAAMALWSVAAAAETPLERGAYLVRAIAACGDCHTQLGPDGRPAGPELAGGAPIHGGDTFVAQPGNITPDPQTGIGGWTDGELIKAIREGVRPDGSIIGPPMPIAMYRGISDNDVQAIVAYLRSVPPVSATQSESEYRMPLPDSYGPPVGSVPDVPRDDKVAYGAYLAGPLGRCIVCHTPMAGKPPRRDYDNQLGAGGFAFDGAWGVSVSSNITPHPQDGLAAWTDEEIKRAITEGIGRDGTPLKPPMPFHFYAAMSRDDLDAIVAYLRSLPPRPTPE